MGTWTANPDLLVALWRIIRENRTARVLELGSGLSTVVMARALEQNQERGELVTLEHHPHYAEQTRRMLAEHGLAEVARVVESPLQMRQIAGLSDFWYTPSSLDGLTDVDLLFVDGPGNRERSMTLFLLHGLLAETAYIAIDDINRPESQHLLELWQHAFPGQLCQTEDKGEKWIVLQWRRSAEQGATRPDAGQAGN